MRTVLCILLLVPAIAMAGNLSNTPWRVGNEPVGDFIAITALGAGTQEAARAVPTFFGVRDPIKRDIFAFATVPPLMMVVANQYPDDGTHNPSSFHYRLWKDGAIAATAKSVLNIIEHSAVRSAKPKSRRKVELIVRWSEAIVVGGLIAISLNREDQK